MDEGNAESRLHFLSELLDTFSESCYIWHYDADGSLMETNCADLVLDKVFRRAESYGYMLDYASENHAPLIMSSAYGLDIAQESVLVNIFLEGFPSFHCRFLVNRVGQDPVVPSPCQAICKES